MGKLTDLAERCEQASADDQGVLLRRAFEAIHGPRPDRIHGGSPELDAWFKLYGPFCALSTSGGYIDAAMTLVPDGHQWRVETPGYSMISKHSNYADPSVGIAATPALALCAAALRARTQNTPDSQGDEHD